MVKTIDLQSVLVLWGQDRRQRSPFTFWKGNEREGAVESFEAIVGSPYSLPSSPKGRVPGGKGLTGWS